MHRTVNRSRLAAVFGLLAAALLPFHGVSAAAQGDAAHKPPAANGRTPVQGYTRINKHTGQPEQVRPHKRRPPAPKPVQVQPYTRGGQPVQGHERQPPAKPAETKPNGGDKKAQAMPPLKITFSRGCVSA